MAAPWIRSLPLILATAAFSECGDTALDVILEAPRLAEVTPVAGSTSLDCRISLSARLGPSGEGREARWTGLHFSAVDPARNRILTDQLDPEETGAIFGDDRIDRGETQQGELVLRLSAPAIVYLNLSYQVLPSEGLFFDGHGSTHLSVPCGVSG